MKQPNIPTPTSTPVLKPSANGDRTQFPAQPPVNTITYWSPSLVTGSILTITLRYLPITHHQNAITELETEETATINIDYLHYLSLIPLAMVASFFATTLFCNTIFGRRPNNDKHHDPLYHQIIQGAGHIIPSALAVVHSIFNFAGKSIVGSRAEEISHIASKALSFVSAAQRIDTIQDRLYDHAMDRSPSLDGNMRRIEYAAMRTENTIIYAAEILTAYTIIMMNMGLTKIQINDNNRLYWLAGTYHAADIVEAALIYPVNEYAYYATRIADMKLISVILHIIGLSDPKHPIKAVNLRSVDKFDKEMKSELKKASIKAVEVLEDFAEAVEDNVGKVKVKAGEIFESFEGGAKEAGEKIGGVFHNAGTQLSNAGDAMASFFHLSSHHQSRPVSTHNPISVSNNAAPHEEPVTKMSSEELKMSNATNNEQENNEDDLNFFAILESLFFEMNGYGIDENQSSNSSTFSTNHFHTSSSTGDIRNLIAQAFYIEPIIENASTNTEGFGIFNSIDHRENGSTTLTANNLHFNFHHTTDIPSNHGGIWSRYSEHARSLGHGIHSYKRPDGTIVITFPNGMELEISGENFHHTDHSS